MFSPLQRREWLVFIFVLQVMQDFCVKKKEREVWEMIAIVKISW